MMVTSVSGRPNSLRPLVLKFGTLFKKELNLICMQFEYFACIACPGLPAKVEVVNPLPPLKGLRLNTHFFYRQLGC